MVSKSNLLSQYFLKDVFRDTEICLFHDGSSMNDVDQGRFGTCYYLATLAGTAALPDVMRQVRNNLIITVLTNQSDQITFYNIIGAKLRIWFLLKFLIDTFMLFACN